MSSDTRRRVQLAIGSRSAGPLMRGSLPGLVLIVGIVLLASCGGTPQPTATQSKAQEFGILPEATTVITPHYKIISTATAEQTAKVATAAEALHRSYVGYFGKREPEKRLELVLYKDQAQFRKYNRSSPWAEAHYLIPRSYAYFAAGENPYHWMVHEATHQLLREHSGYRPRKWINEGIATYFGSSRLVGDELQAGVPDPAAYPIWWMSSLDLSGSLDKDMSAGVIIPLRDLIMDTGPSIDQNVNLYYMHYWSLTHFLFHAQEGRYATQYRELVALGGSLRDFDRLIGPPKRIQSEWYDHLLQQVNSKRLGGVAGG